MHVFRNLLRFCEKLRKKDRLLSRPDDCKREFERKFPKFSYGVSTYGIPNVRDQHPDATLTIGNYCSIAPNVKIHLGGEHRLDWLSSYPFPQYKQYAKHIKNAHFTKGDVIIGNDVWICANAVILSGVRIGDGAVIGNGAIVTRDIPAYAVVAGNPAKVIKWRFDQETINVLLESEWWNWPEAEVASVVDILCSSDIKKFKDFLVERRN